MPLRVLAQMSIGKLFFALGLLALVAASLYADFRWRRWMEERKQERDSTSSNKQ
jgi:hypothetical protein